MARSSREPERGEPRRTDSDPRATYYNQAAAWSVDIHDGLRVTRDLTSAVAAAAVVAACAEGIALLALVPRVRAVP